MCFAVQSFLFIGETISADCILPDPSKIVAINNLKPPNCKTDLLKFLGMIHFLARHVPALSEQTRCLRRLLHKNKLWEWHTPHHDA